MAKKLGDDSQKKKAFIKSESKITQCQHLGNACPCTNLNGTNCKKKQRTSNCLRKAA